jgi:hypothetical protein
VSDVEQKSSAEDQVLSTKREFIKFAYSLGLTYLDEDAPPPRNMKPFTSVGLVVIVCALPNLPRARVKTACTAAMLMLMAAFFLLAMRTRLGNVLAAVAM